MSTFALVYNIVVLVLIIIFTIYAWHALLTSKKGTYPPFVPATGQSKKIIFDKVSEILEKSPKSLTVLDPGCGTGTLLIPLAKKFPQHNFVGIEWSFPYFYAKIKSRGLKNIRFIHDDMFKHSFRDADVVVCFVVDKLAPMLSEKIRSDVKKGSEVFSIYVPLPEMKQKEKIAYKHFGCLESSIYRYKL